MINSIYLDFINSLESKIKPLFEEYEATRFYNQGKVLKAMQEERLSSVDFNWNTGYGYGDLGREKVERIYSNVFKTEDALVRPIIVSGTHAITLALSSLLKSGDELLYISGKPYDTLQKVIGTEGNCVGNFKEQGIEFNYIDLINNNFDFDKIENAISNKTKVIAIQRSTGYGNRNALNINQIKQVVSFVKKMTSAPIFIDNCYGEFVEELEPTEVGADVIAGSLIKNPGGGLALSGGYILGHERFIEQISSRLTAPGLNKDCGLAFGTTRSVLQGLYLAPHIVCEALKSATLFGATFQELGFDTIPKLNNKRSDIVQTITFNSPEPMISFCQAIQKISAVDSHVVPMAWDMPGYEDQVIMASGSFVDGSSIEISADGPMRPPYNVYYQGSLTYDHAKIGLIKVLEIMESKGFIKLF